MRGLSAGNNTDANDDVVKQSVRDADDGGAAAAPADARMKVDSRGQVTRKDVGTGGSCDSSGRVCQCAQVMTPDVVDRADAARGKSYVPGRMQRMLTHRGWETLNDLQLLKYAEQLARASPWEMAGVASIGEIHAASISVAEHTPDRKRDDAMEWLQLGRVIKILSMAHTHLAEQNANYFVSVPNGAEESLEVATMLGDLSVSEVCERAAELADISDMGRRAVSTGTSYGVAIMAKLAEYPQQDGKSRLCRLGAVEGHVEYVQRDDTRVKTDVQDELTAARIQDESSRMRHSLGMSSPSEITLRHSGKGAQFTAAKHERLAHNGGPKI